jgi:hypothetical protein
MITEFLEKIEKNDLLVLATCSKVSVSVRKVCYVYFNDKIYFLTSNKSTKSRDIILNENVGILIDDLQITGKAKSIGSPLLDINKQISITFSQKHNFFFERFKKSKNAEFFEVKLKLIKVWKFVDGKDIWIKEKV